ncbi:MAG: aminotransferase class V-fold PLP-dependent enzyme [Candidatus Aminicenantes bacterium]|nr:aminotransferase class V-fold PLP-dependent enzyme [Candidatus Aminicenantes bacterium]
MKKNGHQLEHPQEEPLSGGLPRRDFVKYLLAGSAFSVAALNKLNAGIYQSITSLNQKYIEDISPDGAYWDEVRKLFLFEGQLIMMNNGTVGPMPKPVFNTLMKYFKVQVQNPYDVYNFLPGGKEGVRDKLAQFIHAASDEVSLTSNTTEGLNFVINGLDLKEGDEVLISNLEHPSALGPWKLKSKRCGVIVKEVKLSLPHKGVEEIVGAFAAAITPKTKIISVGHTVFITGLMTPIKELSKMAHEKGVLVLADSAHGLGMLSLNMKEMGMDFFASSPYKWLGAPTGIGLLFVRKEAQDKLWPTVVASGWDTTVGASKYDPAGQRADAMVYALGEAIDFINHIGKDRVERRIKALAAYLKQGLSKIPGVKINTPTDPYLSAGLTAFSVDGIECSKIVDYVREKYNLVVRTIGSRDAGTLAVRVSTPLYISTKEIDMLVEGVNALVKHKV